VAEFTGFFLLGKMIEFDRTEKNIYQSFRQTDGRLRSQADSDRNEGQRLKVRLQRFKSQSHKMVVAVFGIFTSAI